jgi:HK97 family phage major capsid protein
MTAPTTTADWEHYLNGLDTPEKYGAALKDGSFNKNLSAYIGAQNQERTAMLEDIRQEAKRAMIDFLKENEQDSVKRLNLDPLTGPKKNRAYHNPHAPGAPLNGMFPDLTSFMQATWHHARNDAETQLKVDTIRNSYGEAIPDAGGFLVPEEFRTELMQLALEGAIVRPRATIIPMASPKTNIPCVDETSHVSSLFGGVVVYRTEEGAEIPESQAKFASIKLDVTKQTALSIAPNELVRDWGQFNAFIDKSFPAAIAFSEDVDFLSGNGAGAPLGMLNAANPSLIAVAAASGQTAGTIVWENIIGMYGRMLPQCLDGALWIASPDTFVQLATMALQVGTGGSAIWLTDGTQRPRLTLLGVPVVMSEKAPAVLGTQGDLSLVDPRMYLVGDYQAMAIESSTHVKFTSDKTAFRVIARNDGRPWLLSALTPKNNSASLSPFVQLATR